MSYHIYTTEGFFIESRNTGESSKYFLIFTKELGLVGAMAQGVRLIKSKLRYHTGNFSYGRVSLVRGKEVWRLTNAAEEGAILQSTKTNKMNLALYARILMTLKRLLHWEEKNESLFEIVHAGFTYLNENNLNEDSVRDFESVLMLRILHNLGYVASSEALEFALKDNLWNTQVIQEMSGSRIKAVQTINRALRASHL